VPLVAAEEGEVAVRIGVVADSHVGESLPELPPEVFARLSGVDLVLHAGDITDLAVLRHLERLAPVVAVQGDHDREGGIDLPGRRVIRVEGHRIGLIHGRRSRAVELPAGVLSLISRRPRLLGFHAAMRRRFSAVDCIVHGHLHLPECRRVDGVLYFSPGAVYVPEGDPGYDRNLRSRAYLGFRRGLGPVATRPSVGIIQVTRAALSAHIVPLHDPVGV
jgi:putative phosphoesterase